MEKMMCAIDLDGDELNKSKINEED